MELLAIDVVDSPRARGWVRLTGRVRSGIGAEEEYWFDYPEECAAQVSRSGDPWLACLLPRAVRLGEPLRLSVPVDPRLLDNARERLAIWHAWDGQRPQVAVEAETQEPPGRASRARTGCLFSGGVDSYFTALAPRAAPIDELLLVSGAVDLPLEPAAAVERVRARLADAAAALGKTLLLASTNIMETSLLQSEPARLSLGSLMGAVALGLEDRYERFLVPASVWLGWLPPWGSHPFTDPLLSTTRTTVVCDGVAFSRMAKTAAIADSPVVRASLRVCMKTGDETNCLTCEKCLRTALALEAVGALEHSPTLGGRSLDLRRIDGRVLNDATDRYYAEEVEQFARDNGRADLARVISRARGRSTRRELVGRARRWLSKISRGRDPGVLGSRH